jgi:biopolymer transport protein ExbD
MAKKPKRGAPAIDMTAMVDVAFLLLTFFILTTTSFREDATVEVDMPSSASITEMPPEGMMVLYVTDSGTVFIGYSDISTREQVLQRVIKTRELEGDLTEEGLSLFSSIENFGVPTRELIYWLNLDDEQRLEYVQKGIPYRDNDSLKTVNELKYWIGEGRRSDPYMRFAIRGDSEAPYPVVRQVISTLQDYNINRMSLVTNMEEPPADVGLGGVSRKKSGE